MDRWRKLHGRRLDHEERTRKKAARAGHKASEDSQKLTGLRAKLYQKKRHHEKIQMKKQIKAHVGLAMIHPKIRSDLYTGRTKRQELRAS
jgi:hypothetical protein